jgi:hypothetical protein
MRRFAWLLAILLIALFSIPSVGANQEDKNAQQQQEEQKKDNKTKKFKGDIAELGKDFVKVARKKADGKLVTRKFVVTDKTKIVLDGKEVKFAALKKGTSVVVKFIDKEKSQIALRICNKEEDQEQQKKTP